MRKHGRTDANQKAIVDTLRACGVSVADTSALGDGFPDLVCGRHGVNYMLEIKDGDKSPSRRKLTADEELFHTEWRGTIFIVQSVQDALETLGVVSYRAKSSDAGG